MSINLSLDSSDFAIPITIATMKTHARLLLKKEERMADNWIPFSVDLICYNDRWIVLNAENIEIEEGQYHYEFQLRGMNGEWITVSDGRLNYELIPGQENPSFPDICFIPAFNTLGEEVGSIVGDQMIIGDSVVSAKNVDGDLIRDITVPAENAGDIIINNSTYTIKDQFGNVIDSGDVLPEGNLEIVATGSLPVKNTLDEIIGSIVNNEVIVANSPIRIENSDNVALFSGSVPAENSFVRVINNSTNVIKDSANLTLYNESILAEGSKTTTISDSKTLIYDSDNNLLKQIDVEAEGTKNATIADSQSIIKDSSGTTLHNESILAEGSKETTITDSKSVIKDSSGATLYDESILAQGTKETTITDSTSTIKDSSGADLYLDSIVAQGSMTRTISDSTNVIKDSAGTTLTTTSIEAQGSADTTIADSTYVVKNQDGDVIEQGSILAQGSVEIVVNCSVGLRPFILTYDTNLYTDAIIELSGVGSDPKDIIVRDSLGIVVKALVGNTDNNVEITDLPAGIYDVEVSMPEISRMYFDTRNIERTQATLVELKQWGDVVWGSNLSNLFNGCANLIITASDLMKMETTGVTDRSMYASFQGIGGITNMEWVEDLPIYTMSTIGSLFNQAYGVIDVVLDFNNASHLTSIDAMFIGGEFESITINNMGSTLLATGNILQTSNVPNLEKVLFNDLQLSQNIRGWRGGTAQDYINFFDSIGDRSGKDQRTITMRVQEWDLLDAGQKDYVNQLLIDKNWAIAN